MVIKVSYKFFFWAAVMLLGIAVGIGGIFFLVGIEPALDFLYELAVDIFQNFLRLPERGIV